MNKVKREPSIHISKSLFRKLWNEIGDKVSEEFVDKFLQEPGNILWIIDQ